MTKFEKETRQQLPGIHFHKKKQQEQLSWQNVGCLQNEDRGPKTEKR